MATKFQKTKRMKATLLKGRRTRTATHQTMTFHRMRAKQQQQQQVTSWRLNRVMDVTLLLQSPNQLQLLTLLFEARENTFKSLLIVSSQTDLPPQLFWTKAARLAFSTVTFRAFEERNDFVDLRCHFCQYVGSIAGLRCIEAELNADDILRMLNLPGFNN